MIFMMPKHEIKYQNVCKIVVCNIDELQEWSIVNFEECTNEWYEKNKFKLQNNLLKIVLHIK